MKQFTQQLQLHAKVTSEVIQAAIATQAPEFMSHVTSPQNELNFKRPTLTANTRTELLRS
jgi:hypothetical protein